MVVSLHAKVFTRKRPHCSNIYTFGAPTWHWLKKEDRKGKLANRPPGVRLFSLGIGENSDEQSTRPGCLRILDAKTLIQ